MSADETRSTIAQESPRVEHPKKPRPDADNPAKPPDTAHADDGDEDDGDGGEDEDEHGDQEDACPYCSTAGNCEHLLLVNDADDGTVQGDALYNAFEDKLDSLKLSAEERLREDLRALAESLPMMFRTRASRKDR